jgi:hypothetical protein
VIPAYAAERVRAERVSVEKGYVFDVRVSAPSAIGIPKHARAAERLAVVPGMP